MVCKEDVCEWFGSLPNSKRIDVMCSLLQMCHPLELRFVGSCVEDMAKRDFHYLRELELKANDVKELDDLQNLFDRDARTKLPRLTVYLALLYSSNAVCANNIFNILTAHTRQVLPTRNLTGEYAEELVFLLTIAANHPAFTFYQRSTLVELLLVVERTRESQYNQAFSRFHRNSQYSRIPGEEIEELSERICQLNIHNHPAGDGHFYPPFNPVPPVPFCDTNAPHMVPVNGDEPSTQEYKCNNSLGNRKVHIEKFEFTGSHRGTADKQSDFLIQAYWTNGEVTERYMTYQELASLQMELVKQFGKNPHFKAEKLILPLSQEITNNHRDVETSVHKSLKLLNNLPEEVLQCELLNDFFKAPEMATLVRPPITSPATHSIKRAPSEEEGTSSPVHMRPPVLGHRESLGRPARAPHGPTLVHQLPGNTYRNVPPPPHNVSPHHSPRPSPLSSPHLSPAASSYSSRSTSPGQQSFDVPSWLRKLRLHKYKDKLGQYTMHQLSNLTEKDLEDAGLTYGARNKLTHAIKELKGQNGLIEDNAQPVTWSPGNTLSPSSSHARSLCNASFDSSGGDTSQSDNNSRSNSPSLGMSSRQDSEDFQERQTDLEYIDDDVREQEVPRVQHNNRAVMQSNGPMVSLNLQPETKRPMEPVMVGPVPIRNMVPLGEEWSPHFGPRAAIRSQRPQAKPVIHGSANIMSGPKMTGSGTFLTGYLPRISSTNHEAVTSAINPRPISLGIQAPYTSVAYPSAPILEGGNGPKMPPPGPQVGPPLMGQVQAAPMPHVLPPPEMLKVMFHSVGSTPTSSTVSYASSTSCYPNSTPAGAGIPQVPPVTSHSTPTPGSSPNPPSSTPAPPGWCTCCGHYGPTLAAAPNGGNNGGPYNLPPASVWSHVVHNPFSSSNGVINPNMLYGHPMHLPNGMPPEAVMQFNQTHNYPMAAHHPPNTYMTTPPVLKRTMCYNCGSSGHIGSECKEQTLAVITSRGNYQLDYKPKSDSE